MKKEETTGRPFMMDRRSFLMASAGLAATFALGGLARFSYAGGHMLMPLPYEENALEPFISGRTMGFHYRKHHMGYVKKLNSFIKGTRYEDIPLERIIRESAGNAKESSVFNNAAQVYNHAFYWESLKPNGGGEPNKEVAAKIRDSFGGLDAFKKEFASAALSQFGSGWAWLVEDGRRLRVMRTANADTPIAHGIRPLLTIDVWEHAYYLDYQNRRGDYVDAVIKRLINWDFATHNLSDNSC